MRVLVTGGFGLVGREVVTALCAEGHAVRVLDSSRAAVPRPYRRRPGVEVRRGDLCSIRDVGEAVRDVDAICHVGAIIPPAADRRPRYADYVNRGGTHVLLEAARREAPGARFVYASSIAIYGDRRACPMISAHDKPHPNADDAYAHQKLEAESLVRRSKLRWTILRLTYIVSPRKLAMDPLMFEMPLDTPLEVCTAEDAGLALARATISDCLLGTTANLAGGERCRTTYSDYLDHMTEAFGLGTGLLPECAFGPGPFHCAYMDTREAQRALEFQRHTLDDYYVAVRHAMRFKRPVLRVLRPLIRASLLRKSPYRKQATRQSPAHFGSLAGGRRVSPSH